MMDYAARVAQADTYPKMLRLNAKEHGSEIALREKDLGLWRPFTWNDYQTRVRDFALGLVELGLGRGDVIGIIGDNRPDWIAAEVATHAIGGLSLGLYRDVLDEEASYLLNYGEAQLVFAEDEEQVDKLLALAERVAQADITVLINGPTGTGKEVLARTIHANSPRRDGPFVALNCAALPETMLEAMLFGHQKGAFTGASSGGEGFFRAAHGGTILLDEIAEMPLALQAKLLRVLQEREVVPIGATQPVAVDVRVIACANRDLQAEVAAGRFRADLYYRLSVFPLTTRALADRPQDIPALAATMILRHAGNRTMIPWPSAEAIAELMAHDWPGNVRELENVIQRALLFAAGGTIEAEHIVFDRPAPRALAPVDIDSATLGKVVQLSEFAAIRETLRACNGSRIETARRLGISERTLRYRLAKAREQGEDIAAPHGKVASA